MQANNKNLPRVDFIGAGEQLSRDDIIQEAISLRVQPAALIAVVDIEAAGEGFISKIDTRMKALYEAHVFSRFTNHRFDQSHRDISSRSWNKALYGAGGAHQYDRIERAMELDETAALKATSWGLGQVLGMNHQMVGFNTPQAMVEALKQGERQQLDAMTEFCKASGALEWLQRSPPSFDGFARIYNGTGQVEYYADRLHGAYYKALQGWLTATATPRTEPIGYETVLVKGLHDDPRVVKLQQALRDNGFYRVPPYKIDGDYGPGTEWAVMQAQTAYHLARDGVAGPFTLGALGLTAEARNA